MLSSSEFCLIFILPASIEHALYALEKKLKKTHSATTYSGRVSFAPTLIQPTPQSQINLLKAYLGSCQLSCSQTFSLSSLLTKWSPQGCKLAWRPLPQESPTCLSGSYSDTPLASFINLDIPWTPPPPRHASVTRSALLSFTYTFPSVLTMGSFCSSRPVHTAATIHPFLSSHTRPRKSVPT